jgi:hypothetical protein
VHVDEERLQRLLHGELGRTDEAEARAHLADCEECSRRLAAMTRDEERVDSLLRVLDRPAPRVDVRAIARRADARRPWIPRWAAGVVLVLGLAGVAYALPGSPLPRLVDAVVEWAKGRRDPLSPGAGGPVPPNSSAAGIAVSPGERFTILFQTPNARGEILVRLTQAAEIEVRAPRDVATFTAGESQLVVDGRGISATYEIDVPLTAPRIEIRAGEDRIFLKEGSRVTTSLPPGSAPPYRLAIPTPRR